VHSPVVRYGGADSGPPNNTPHRFPVRELWLRGTLTPTAAKGMKLDQQQPWGVWAFVIGLNVLGFTGYFILKAMGITLYSIHAS
jgi:hypothetical protein